MYKLGEWFEEKVDDVKNELKKRAEDNERRQRARSKPPAPPPPILDISAPVFVTPEQRASARAETKSPKQKEAEKILMEIISYQTALASFLQLELNRKGNFNDKKNNFYASHSALSLINSRLNRITEEVKNQNSDIGELTGILNEIKKLVEESNKTAKVHRENFDSHTVMWLVKFNWLRKPQSYTEFQNYFEIESQDVIIPKIKT